jgi:hypothetical protein
MVSEQSQRWLSEGVDPGALHPSRHKPPPLLLKAAAAPERRRAAESSRPPRVLPGNRALARACNTQASPTSALPQEFSYATTAF